MFQEYQKTGLSRPCLHFRYRCVLGAAAFALMAELVWISTGAYNWRLLCRQCVKDAPGWVKSIASEGYRVSEKNF